MQKFHEILSHCNIATPVDLMKCLEAFLEESGEGGNCVQYFTQQSDKADAAFKQMTYAGKIALSKALRVLIHNKDVIICGFIQCMPGG